MAQLLIPASTTYALTVTLVRVSILLLYGRIFATLNFRRATIVLGATSVAWCIAVIVGHLLICRPISAAWHVDLIISKCGDMPSYFMGVSISNMMIDVLVLCLPVRMVLTLHLPTRKKIVVSSIFMLGGLYVILQVHLAPWHPAHVT
jgi:hypothetical protein